MEGSERPLPGVPQFGRRDPAWTYEDRPSAYAIHRRASGDVLCVRAKGALHLPGGGVHAGETPEEAVLRELREETGYEGVVLRVVARANQYVVAVDESRAVNKRAVYFEVLLEGPAQGPAEHESVWVPAREAVEHLVDEAHQWAVARVALRE